MSRTGKRVALHLALAAMLLRALLPSGWMPSANPTIPLVMCTMNGPVRVLVTLVEEPHKQSPSPDHGRQHEVCPFAAAVSFAPPRSGVTLAPPNVAARLVATLRLATAAAPNRPYAPQSPRAPPLAV